MQIATAERYRTPVLQSLCVAGDADIDGVARRCGVAVGIVHGELVAAEALGLVTRCQATGRWSSTPVGRVVVRQLLSDETTETDVARLAALRARISGLETVVNDLMAQWFLRQHPREDGRPGVPINDHRDMVYDAAVLEAVAAAHAELIVGIYAAVVVVPSLERYAGRLADAWRRVRLGDHAALGEPGHDAYFDVWAEFLRELDARTP